MLYLICKPLLRSTCLVACIYPALAHKLSSSSISQPSPECVCLWLQLYQCLLHTTQLFEVGWVDLSRELDPQVVHTLCDTLHLSLDTAYISDGRSGSACQGISCCCSQLVNVCCRKICIQRTRCCCRSQQSLLKCNKSCSNPQSLGQSSKDSASVLPLQYPARANGSLARMDSCQFLVFVEVNHPNKILLSGSQT